MKYVVLLLLYHLKLTLSNEYTIKFMTMKNIISCT